MKGDDSPGGRGSRERVVSATSVVGLWVSVPATDTHCIHCHQESFSAHAQQECTPFPFPTHELVMDCWYAYCE